MDLIHNSLVTQWCSFIGAASRTMPCIYHPVLWSPSTGTLPKSFLVFYLWRIPPNYASLFGFIWCLLMKSFRWCVLGRNITELVLCSQFIMLKRSPGLSYTFYSQALELLGLIWFLWVEMTFINQGNDIYKPPLEPRRF